MPREPSLNVEELFKAAVDRPPGDRRALLDARCPSDPAVRAEVESMLRHYDAAQSFLEEPAAPRRSEWPCDTGGICSPAAAPMPQRIGSYRILDVLGVGGMGVVYRAEQENPRRLVALKLIRPGSCNPALLRRFEHEAQMLARLQHPGIAQVHEAGTADTGQGLQPYFAMELVRGQPLLEYAETRRLAVRERLTLLAMVCDAVHHAHQKGVIHRDLKPSNILVDEAGRPKILDFGVARAIDSDVQATTVQTDVGQIIGTIPYMSPEQCAGDPHDLDTRSDVYSLGVTGYELLTSRLPHDLARKSLPEAVRIIRDEEPVPPSTVSKALRGDVETILAKALEKDRARRYPSASELAADIRRYLANEPILARAAGPAYRLLKFARRNKVLVAGVVGIFLALAVGVTTTAWQGLQARREAQNGRELIAYLKNMFAATKPGGVARDSELTVREWLDEAAKRLDTEPFRQPSVEAELRQVMAESYTNLGRYDEAIHHRHRLLEIQRTQLHSPDSVLAGTLQKLAASYYKRADYVEAEKQYREAIEVRRKSAGPDHVDIADIRNDLARCRLALDDAAGAELLYRQTLDVFRRSSAPKIEVAASSYNLAAFLQDQSRYAEAEPLFREVLAMTLAERGAGHLDTAYALHGLGTCLIGTRDFAGAEELLHKALVLKRDLLDRNHSSVASTLSALGRLKYLTGNLQDAEGFARDALNIRWKGSGFQPHPDVAESLDLLGLVLTAQNDDTGAEQYLRESLSIRRSVRPESAWRTAQTQSLLGFCYAKRGCLDEAETMLAESYAVILMALGPAHEKTNDARDRLLACYERTASTPNP